VSRGSLEITQNHVKGEITASRGYGNKTSFARGRTKTSKQDGRKNYISGARGKRESKAFESRFEWGDFCVGRGRRVWGVIFLILEGGALLGIKADEHGRKAHPFASSNPETKKNAKPSREFSKISR